MTDVRILERYGCFEQDSPALTGILQQVLRHRSTREWPCRVILRLCDTDELDQPWIGKLTLMCGVPAHNESINVCRWTMGASKSMGWETTLDKHAAPDNYFRETYKSLNSGQWSPDLPPQVAFDFGMSSKMYDETANIQVFYFNGDENIVVYTHQPSNAASAMTMNHDVVVRRKIFPILPHEVYSDTNIVE